MYTDEMMKGDFTRTCMPGSVLSGLFPLILTKTLTAEILSVLQKQ